ncbi:MAG: sulfotransferase family protein [Limimaricola sp.]|uniref:sulfotransferase family protein n=1 Tax=Limimaricola sp. TaxID=2211665 RepID=UPI001D95C819|nr:sulfotransferase family protein [Limimaricola sp.]MBI1417433.1 sulfotransferase family protein [Limimaricola sp.]
MKVIGTGFGRTGTDSMRNALNMLGFGPTHHMFEVNASETQKARWRQLGAGAAPDWDLLLEGFGACVDWPSAAYWPEILAHWPDAKAILTYRDPDSWFESYARTIGPHIMKGPDDGSVGQTIIRDRVFGGRAMDRDHVISVYNANIAKVRDTVPSDRLLVHNLGDGWEPLCAFLGVPVPKEPYPRGNDTATFQARIAERAAQTGD